MALSLSRYDCVLGIKKDTRRGTLVFLISAYFPTASFRRARARAGLFQFFN